MQVKSKLIVLLSAIYVACAVQAQMLTDSGEIGTYTPLYGAVAPVCDIEDLLRIHLEGAKVLSAEKIADEDICLVTISAHHAPAQDTVRIWVALPMRDWNGRFYGCGGSGFRGGDPQKAIGAARRGFAAAATDTGHPGSRGAFALDSAQHRLNWPLIQDFAYLGIHDMTRIGKELVRAYYGKPAAYSYFVGESTGGRQDLMEAQRYPDDYQGIMSGCPAINWPSFVAAELWPQVVMYAEDNFVSADKLEAVTQAVIRACDGDDGIVDGVIQDPLRCTWDPAAFVGTRVGEAVFTDQDAEVVRRIWDGPRASNGDTLWYGFTRGTDLTGVAATGGSPLRGIPFFIPMDWFRYFLTLDPALDIADIDYAAYELLFRQSVEEFGTVIATDNPDLRPFRDSGGKLLILHGLSDHLIPAQGTIQYYNRVLDEVGEAETRSFARLFLLPGLNHGFLGNAPRPTRQLDALIAWVEHGIAPDSLPAARKNEAGEVVAKKSIAAY